MQETITHKRMTDQELFETELIPHADALYNFAYHLTYNEEDANDLVQEAYLKAYKYIYQYQSGTNGKAWLFRILKNTFINDYRKVSKQPNTVDYQELVDIHMEDEIASSHLYDLREEIFNGSMGDEISTALNDLPIDFKTVILLCDIEGFSYEEISKILEIPIGTVRSRLHRGRNILKEKLHAYAVSMGYK